MNKGWYLRNRTMTRLIHRSAIELSGKAQTRVCNYYPSPCIKHHHHTSSVAGWMPTYSAWFSSSYSPNSKYPKEVCSPSITSQLTRNQFSLHSGSYFGAGRASDLLPITRNIQFRCLHSTTRCFSNGEKKSGEQKLQEENSDDLAKKYTDSQKTTVEPAAKLTLVQRFKKAYKEHGKILIGVHITTSVMWYTMFYALARSGIDLVPYLEQWNFNEKVINTYKLGGDFALTVLFVKLATPARYTVTLLGTHYTVKFLRRSGRMQPLAQEDTLSSMYKEGSDNIRRSSRIRMTKGRKSWDRNMSSMKSGMKNVRSRLSKPNIKPGAKSRKGKN